MWQLVQQGPKTKIPKGTAYFAKFTVNKHGLAQFIMGPWSDDKNRLAIAAMKYRQSLTDRGYKTNMVKLHRGYWIWIDYWKGKRTLRVYPDGQTLNY